MPEAEKMSKIGELEKQFDELGKQIAAMTK